MTLFFSGWVSNVIPRVLIRGRSDPGEVVRDMITELRYWSSSRKGSGGQESRWLPEAGKGQQVDSSLELPPGMALQIPWL